ncbi:hypothetical protein M441DRAFT_72290 [Trichoderma asperellum CBS 433.97]|uniref:Uncharacterized protein n=1 Tax=Trichoderma asperellum (strain ATCC 204424 / CBS 433.97 / NBRC 101777) TaxID=1042311 RepID=A0A2T3YZ75_TRIA4|nr:hypothetical protein M441DRAFT_72290 [Trichoderma asperellum CBS 433.97]PTB37869.1 hypothetical protein M441DRAFT_72290 [Trichoderma asperellum CBS 433.97]
MDRARRPTTNRRKPQGVSSSPTSGSDASFERNQSSASPIMAHATNTPQAAQQNRRAQKTLQPAFTFSTPGPTTRPLNLRKRSKTMDDYSVADEDFENDSPKKGGHSLRKRARVDYTFEQIDDDIDFSSAIPGSASAAASAPRNRRRRPDSNSYDSEDLYGSGLKRRGASVDADTPSSRRRYPARKTSESRAYRDEFDDDENDVQDTIEVGVLYSDSEKSDSAHMDLSNASSTDLSVEAPQKPTTAHSGFPHQDSDLKSADHAAAPAPTSLDVDPSGNAAGPASASDSDSASASASTSAAADINMPQPQADRARLPDSAAPASTADEKTAEPQPNARAEGDATRTFSDEMAAPPESYADELKSPRSSTPQNSGRIVNSNDREREPSVQPVQMSPAPSTPPPAVHATAEANNTALTHAAENDTPAEETACIKPLNQLPEKEIPQENPEAPPESDTHPQPQPQAQQESQARAQPQEPPYYPSAAAHLITLTAPSVQQLKSQVQAEEAHEAQTPESEPDSKAPSPPPITVTAAAEDEADGTPASPSISALGSTTLDASQSTSTDTTCVEPRVSLPEDGADAVVSPPLPEIQVQVEGANMKPADPAPPSQPSERGPFKPQPRPEGRWAHLTPYIDGEYVAYPEKKAQQEDEVTTSEDQTADDREANDMEPMVDDNDDIPDAAGIEAPTPALNTPLRGSPVPDSIDPTASNSPAAGGDDGDDVDVTEEPPERSRSFRYRKLRDPNEYLAALENFEEMSTEDLYEVLESINISLVQWQTEWNGLGKIVDDYENSLRRRVADVKYESRTRNFHQHGVNYEEPEFVVKGYRSKDREGMTETRYLQNQDRIMAAAYGFEYDPHPSKIGRQNPETQQAGIMTRGRSLRNQPKPTAKATEADEVTGKRQRKPVQLFDPATQDVSRSSTPVPTTRPRRRRTANADNDESQVSFAASFNSESISDDEAGDGRRRRNRAARPKMNVPSIIEELAPAPPSEDSSVRETPSRSGRNKRVKQPPKYDEDPLGYHFVEEEPPKRRHLLTLKIPKGKNISEPSSAITDNGDSRPSTADSDSTSHTAESSYSFRPKRQKRFRDDAEESEEASQAPTKKKNKRINVVPSVGVEEFPVLPEMLEPEAALGPNRKIQKIKVVRTTPASRKGTPSSLPNGEEAEEPPKDYKSMTKSEKMSASMKSRWANGNMAGAVEKRKATLAAKKAAQAAAEQRVGLIAPKPKMKAAKKEPIEQNQMPPPFAPQQPPQQMHGMGYPYPPS